MCRYGNGRLRGNKQTMKRYGNLYERVCSPANIAAAHAAASRGKAHYREVRMVNANPARYLGEIREQLTGKTFRTAPYSVMIKNEYGKERVIHKLPYFPDRIVHHAVVQVAGPIWDRTLIRDTYACIKGRGIHDGAKRVKAALRDREGTRYCLKMDARKFYPSMDHAVIKAILRRKIKDGDLLWLLDEVVDSAPTPVGVPIGNYLSQFFGNLHLSGYDHWMKEAQGCRYYFRYCDDVVVLDGDKARLHALRSATAAYWAEHLKLDVKDNWQVFPVAARGIDFLGYRFFHGYTLLRKSIALKFKRRMRTIKQRHETMPPVSITSAVASYGGWMKHANCRHLAARHLDHDITRICDLARERLKQQAEAA